MDVLFTPVPRPRILAAPLKLDAPALGAFAVGVAPVLYLALHGGGYDQVIYSEAGILVWWIVLLGMVTGLLSVRRIAWPGWSAIALLGLFAIWTGVGVSWSSSAERTVAELGRVATYLGFLVLGLCVVRRGNARALLGGIAVAFGLVSLLAVLSRLYPGAFPTDQLAPFFPHAYNRLNYPFNYANGTGNFLAIGIPLLLLAATDTRSVPGAGVAAAAIPVAVLGILMTASRGAVLTAVTGIAVFYLLVPDRLPRIATGLTAAAGSGVLIVSLLHRRALRSGLSTPVAIGQRHQLMLLLITVCLGVGLVQVAIRLAARYAMRPRWLRISRRQASLAAAAALLLATAGGVAARVPSKLAHQWDIFKGANVTGVSSSDVYSRLGTLSGSHRYQYWTAAIHAFRTRPLTGIGPGTFAFYWERHAPFYEYIRNAHSLYLETLAETGLVGVILIVGFLILLLGVGVGLALRAPPRGRVILAGATASLAAFCAAAAYDWVWQLPALPVAALLLGSVILAQRRRRPWWSTRRARWPRWPPRIALGVMAVAAMVAVAIPFAATSAVRASQADVRAGDLQAALNDASTAQTLEPYAATPRLQTALILEQAGDLPGARSAIAQAISREPMSYTLWLLRARIEAESGNVAGAVDAFRQAHTLDPLSPLAALPTIHTPTSRAVHRG